MIRRIFFIILSFFLLFLKKQNLISQYRDPFSEKTKVISIKKRNKNGLIYATKSFFSKKQKNSFLNQKKNNGIIGLDHDPFKFKRKNFYKPTGVEEDSFTTKHRKMAYSNKYDKESLKKKAIKSRNKYIKKK
ncbi:hypothetical protein N9X23_01665 [Flavobacteriales bacterium]|nr:hypothetical protein [Flavobacteriales bacterium]